MPNQRFELHAPEHQKRTLACMTIIGVEFSTAPCLESDMAETLETIKNQIKNLNSPEKAELLRALVAELEPETENGVAQAWIEEAKRRHAELASGAVSPIPASVVFQRARERLKG